MGKDISARKSYEPPTVEEYAFVAEEGFAGSVPLMGDTDTPPAQDAAPCGQFLDGEDWSGGNWEQA